MFFLLAALVCLLLVPLADEEFRWVTLAVSITYRSWRWRATSTSAAAADATAAIRTPRRGPPTLARSSVRL